MPSAKLNPAAAHLRDGCLSFEGGVDGGRSPSDIKRNQVAGAVNTTFRGSKARPRPTLVHRELSFGTETTYTRWNAGKFQHAAFYDGAGIPYLMSSHGGRLFATNVKTWKTQEITPKHTQYATEAGSTTTTANFVVPALYGRVEVTVTSTAGMFDYALVNITIGGTTFVIIGATSATTCVVMNGSTANNALIGTTIASGAAVAFTKNSTTIENVFEPNSSRQDEGWSAQAETYWIYQDNQSHAVIFDGASSRRSDPSEDEVPVGNDMAYAKGRLVVGLPDRQSFRVGDLVFGDGTVAALVKFTENDFLNEGGDFIARTFGGFCLGGFITAMKPLAMSDTSLGQGPLLIGTPNAVFTIQLPFDRMAWKNMTSPLETVSPIPGPVSHDSAVIANGDLWYRAPDGIRSYVLAQRDQNTNWAKTPQSREVNYILSLDARHLLGACKAAVWNNYAMWTCNPNPSTMGTYHRGLVVMDFDPASNLTERSNPAWSGVWTGLKILSIVSGTVDNEQRCWVFVLNSLNKIEIWEFDLIEIYDGGNTSIQGSYDLPSMNYGDAFLLKNLSTGELFIDDVRGAVSITVKYRPDQYPCWVAWDTFTLICQTDTDCTVDPNEVPCEQPRDLQPQFRSKLKLLQPADTFDTANSQRMLRTAYEFQPRIEFTGHFELKQARFLSVPAPESANAERSTFYT